VPEIGESLSSSPLWEGSYVEGEAGRPARFVLRGGGGESVDDALGIAAALVKPAAPISAVCCRDDYEWWRSHGYAPSADNREKQIGGSGGSLEPLGLFLHTYIPFLLRILSAFLPA
jgi:hypothetical protein